MVKQVQLYDDSLDFPINRDQGPFGDYANANEPYHNQGEPQYDFFGLPVYSPFGIGAGPLPTAKFIQAALNQGFDIVTLKSVRTSAHPLNPYPQVRPVQVAGDLQAGDTVTVAEKYSDNLAVANSFGIPSVEPSEWQQTVRDSVTLATTGQHVLIAFQGTARGDGRSAFVQDHVEGVGLIKECGVNIVEINLSCPNEGEASLACFDIPMTRDICMAVRKAYPQLKFFIKIAYFEDKDQLRELVEQTHKYVDGYSAINTIGTQVVSKDGKEVFPGRPTAGVSGAPIKWAGIEMCQALNNLRTDLKSEYKIVALGGVLNAADFSDYLTAGADTVMSVAGAMWNPDLAREIKKVL